MVEWVTMEAPMGRERSTAARRGHRLMVIRGRQWLVRWAVLLVAVTVPVATSCSASHQPAVAASDRQSVIVSPRHDSSLRLAGGVSVTVPAGSVASPGRLTGEVVHSPGPAPSGLAFAGQVYRLQVSGTEVTGHVSLTLPVPSLLANRVRAGPDAAMLAYYDAATGRWQPVPAVYHPASHTISAASAHLSVWTVLRVDTDKILGAAANALKRFIGMAGTTSQPSCPDRSRQAAGGTTGPSDQGSLVTWCTGTINSAGSLLRVADSRNFAVETDYPHDWSARLIGSADPVTSQIITSVARILSPVSGGQVPIIVPGGHDVQYTAPAGASGAVSVAPTSEAYLIDAFLYAAETLALTFDGIPGVPKSNSSATTKAIERAFTAMDCLTQMDTLADADVSTARAVGELFRGDVELAVRCLGEQWQKAYGITGFTGHFVADVALWLPGGIRLVVNGLQSAVNGAIYWRGYRIALSAKPVSALARYSGTWYSPVQGLELIVNPDGQATLWANGDSCGKPGWQQACLDKWSMSFSGPPDSVGLHGVITSNSGTYFENEKGDPVTLSTISAPGVISMSSPIGDGARLCQVSELGECSR